MNRMETKRDHFLGCKELPLLKNEENLINEAADNGVSDIIDMTGGSLLKDNTDIAEELASVNFVRPHMQGQKKLQAQKASLTKSDSESAEFAKQVDIALPSIVYPVKLKSYEMPNDLGSYIFWCNHVRFSG